ncbi:hypothetical protein EJB05_34290 [Eragrostis curvula]|uniref:DUF6598 domain-containing protein n=1 Tax=Eragrostis curvula TaxID=38414 RepID=A0A5J9U3L2_9POAL|nr:hypothetical protein EJB05_34290 [Eragrostis curvula]
MADVGDVLAQQVEILDFFGSPGPLDEGYEDEEEEADLEPFFFDEAEAVADHQRRLLREEEAFRQEQLVKYRFDRVTSYDPKQGGLYYTRFGFYDLATFDPEEESPLGPMRHTDAVYEGGNDAEVYLYPGINILSVKIVTLDDLKFPIHVYGTVVARDSVDCKCVYLFRRDEDHCQVINSESESLILDGPKRGLVLVDDAHVEIDLKIKDPQWGSDIELSKGFVLVRSINRRLKNVVESKSLESRLSTVEVTYAVVKDAVEATIAIEVLGGKFNGEITAYTTSIPDRLVLHDGKVAGKRGGYGKGTIQLSRSVVTVDIKDMLKISAETGDGKFERTIDFTPRVNSWDEDVITVGATRMHVKVTWSIIY